MNYRCFVWAVLLFVLAAPIGVDAAPMTQSLGSALATLTLTPDPPATGTAHAVVVVSGAPAAALAKTSLSFTSAMPSMNMAGAGGSATRIAAGRYAFDLPLGMAGDVVGYDPRYWGAQWSRDLRCSGRKFGRRIVSHAGDERYGR